MPKLKTTQVKVSALATNPNKYALPAGSCAVAENVVMRQPGVLTPLDADVTVYSTDTAGIYKPVKLYNSPLYGGRVGVVQADAAQSAIWKSTEPETQTGRVDMYAFTNQYTVPPSTPAPSRDTTQLCVGWKFITGTSGNIEPVNRAPGFIPGMTHDAYNTFRSFLTEKWGVIASNERYAGLYAPMLQLALTQIAAVPATINQDNWLVPGGTVSYRAVLSLEVAQPPDDPEGLFTPVPKAYIVVGPPSQVFSIKNEDYGDNCCVQIIPRLNMHDAIVPVTYYAGWKYYVSIYRCPQDEVRDPTRLTDDYRLVAKLLVPEPSATQFPSIGAGAFNWTDTITEDSRNGGEALYTNTGQQGEQGANYCPPSAADICVFKDTTFYANRASFPTNAFEMRGAFGDLLTDREVTYGIGHRAVQGTATASSFQILTTAPELVGMEIGQVIVGATFAAPPQANVWPAGTYVTITSVSVGTNRFSVSVAVPPGTSGAVNMVTADRIDVRLDYADGTASPVIHFDPTDPVGSATAWNGTAAMPALYAWPAGLRFQTLFGHVIDSYPPQEGYRFAITHTTPWHKRVTKLRVSMTNRQNYSPQGAPIDVGTGVEGTYELRRNIVYLSKTSEPEHVPLGNFQIIGAGVILKMWSTTSAIFFFCTDGVWRLTGDGTTWTVDQIDPTAVLIHPDLVTSLNNKIYAIFQSGLAVVTDAGVQVVSDDAIGSMLRDQVSEMRAELGFPGKRQQLPYVFGPTMEADHHFNEVWWVLTVSFGGESYMTSSYIFNDETQAFTTQTSAYKGITYYARNDRLVYVKGLTEWDLAVKSDFYTPGSGLGTGNRMPATIRFNPLVSEDMGDLKEWIDMSFFMELYGEIRLLWNNEAREYVASVGPEQRKFPAAHFWVPREYSLRPILEDCGFTTNIDGLLFPAQFTLYGFTVRYRVASDTLKRA